MPSQWDHKADKDLLLTIIEDGNLTHINWQSVSAKLEAKKYTFSHEACRQHYQKIRKESRNNATTSTTSTPTKASTNNGSKSTPASKNQRTPKSLKSSASNSVGGGDEEDDEEEFPTPSAKRKRVPKKQEPDLGGFAGQTAAQFKIEEFDDGNEGEGEGENGRVNGGRYRNVVDLVDDGIYAV